MVTQRSISRRRMLGMGGSVLALGGARAADQLGRTPSQATGPFYPLDKPLDADADLTFVKGRQHRAQGQVVHVSGRVLNSAGVPIKGARIEIWQANTHGRYAHAGDDNPAPLDPGFEGYADLRTDEEGRYRFKTIKPGAYPAGGGTRPPHIHFDVSGRVSRLVTQMYFPGEPLNDRDGVIGAARANRHLLIAEVAAPTGDLPPDALVARWDIVLETG
jgi:protocatechuate 3,4-dioxygenase, beta subunit